MTTAKAVSSRDAFRVLARHPFVQIAVARQVCNRHAHRQEGGRTGIFSEFLHYVNI